MQAVGIIQMVLQLVIYSSEQKVPVVQMNEVHISFHSGYFLDNGNLYQTYCDGTHCFTSPWVAFQLTRTNCKSQIQPHTLVFL